MKKIAKNGGRCHLTLRKGKWWCGWCKRPIRECWLRMVDGHCREMPKKARRTK
ncbi:MAG: hypothetical protein ABH877_02735 [bacterium]